MPDTRSSNLVQWHDNYARSRLSFGRRLAGIMQLRLNRDNLSSVRVLDIGCGEGWISRAFADSGARVTAMDYDSGRIVRIVSRFASNGSQMPFGTLVADAHALPFPPAHFDIVVMSDLLEHVDHPRKCLDEAVRVMKPGGLAYVATTSRSSFLTCLRDPHYGVPGVSLLPRAVAAWYVTRLWRVTGNYGVNKYFFGPELDRLFRSAGLDAELLQGRYEEKIKALELTSVPARGLLLGLLRRPWVQASALRFCRTSAFRHFVQPTWELLAVKRPALGRPPFVRSAASGSSR